MKTQLRIVLIFVVIFFASFIPDNYHEFFGDWLCQGSGNSVSGTFHYDKCNYPQPYYHLPEWHWGFRHYIWLLFGFTMTIFNVIKIVNDEEK
jgi:hypothetical protein